MRRAHLVSALVGLLVLRSLPASAQESKVVADFQRERKELAQSCGSFAVKAIGSCAYSLLTLHPVHVAVGGLAPQNGFAFGGAFVERFTPNESWRLSWNSDVVASPSGSWRAGGYMKMVHTPATAGVVVIDNPDAAIAGGAIAPREFAAIDFFVQGASLKTVAFFGPGPDSLASGQSFFGERQTIIGGSVAYPLSDLKGIGRLRPTVIGGVSGRFVGLRPGSPDEAPSIEALYDEAAAPGLGRDTRYLELREAVRFKPSLVGGWLRFNYLFSAEQARAHAAPLSFNRWTMDLRHEIPLWTRSTRSTRAASMSGGAPADGNGPDECPSPAGSAGCGPVSWSRNRQGTIGIRALVTTSTASGPDAVPFYLQPTLGGADINNERLLAGFDDYRFRAPNLIALQSTIEHSIWGPLGAFAAVEGGKVAMSRGDLSLSHLRRSATVGVTLRAGGFPLVNLSFSWTGEGHHVIGEMSSTLLGGSPRPSLF